LATTTVLPVHGPTDKNRNRTQIQPVRLVTAAVDSSVSTTALLLKVSA